ncbi:hypothetical protein [Nocardioides alkalitolerans]|uniref:hypothetical protein n=1 Tax=Nocardioides alkalitolerans TaxID=281714 RepID=UPI0012F958F8|nr:hypothetical protein [Nocardioides alkalitolerans]
MSTHPTEAPAGTTPAELREAVRQLVASGRRRVFPAAVHVGRPAGASRSMPAAGLDDHALRADALTVLVDGLLLRESRGAVRHLRVAPAAPPSYLVWLTRPGDVDVQDADLAWVAATRTASAELGVDLVPVVVTRHGWWDPVGDGRRTWRRMRATR